MGLTGDPDADRLLAEDPFALLIGMLLDQQVPMETAFAGPAKIADRMGGLDPGRIAEVDPEEFAALCATPPAVHRFPVDGRPDPGRREQWSASTAVTHRGCGRMPTRDAVVLRRLRGCRASASRRPRSSWPCSASSAACARQGGVRCPRRTATRAGTSRSPMSRTRSPWPRCARRSGPRGRGPRPEAPMTRVVLLAGGVGGARFTRGLRDLGRAEGLDLDLTVVVNTGDDLWLDALRVCPDLDTVMYTLGGVIGEQGWGRAGESTRVTAELHGYGLGWEWFTLGDLDLGTHLARTELLRSGLPLSAVTARLCERWQPGARVLPMSDDEVETWVDVERDGEVVSIHFEEWWVRYRAALPALRFVQRGVGGARPAPGVLEAIAEADLVLLPPSNPVVSVGTILGVPGIRDAVRAAHAPSSGCRRSSAARRCAGWPTRA